MCLIVMLRLNLNSISKADGNGMRSEMERACGAVALFESAVEVAADVEAKIEIAALMEGKLAQ